LLRNIAINKDMRSMKLIKHDVFRHDVFRSPVASLSDVMLNFMLED